MWKEQDRYKIHDTHVIVKIETKMLTFQEWLERVTHRVDINRVKP